MPNKRIEGHALVGTTHVYRRDLPRYRRDDDPTPGQTILGNGMRVEVLAVFRNWNDVAGLDMLYVHVPATGHGTHVTPADLGLPPLMFEHPCGAYPPSERHHCGATALRRDPGSIQGVWYSCPTCGLYLSIDWCECDELDADTREATWVAGWNTPGYLPEAEPVACETWHVAHAYIIEAVERFWDEDADADDVDEDARWLPVHTALHVATTNQPYSVMSEQLVFWVIHKEDADV